MPGITITVDSLIEGAQKSQGVACVIDVCRCFTTEAIAFERGAEKIILVAEIEESTTLKIKVYVTNMNITFCCLLVTFQQSTKILKNY